MLRVEPLEHRDLAATFTVLNTGDNGGIDPAVGAGTGTLRQAIIDAGAANSDDDIHFDAAAFATPATLALQANLPTIKNGRLNIFGPGVGKFTINGGGNFSLFANDSSAKVLQLTDMTLTGGSGSLGGAITVAPETDAFFLIRSKVTGNTGLKAGGIYSRNGQMQISESTVSNNTGPSGGIAMLGAFALLDITSSTISGNTGTSNDPYSGGGVAFVPVTYGQALTVTNSTIHGNSSLNKKGGAGILLTGERLSTDNFILHSTVTENTSPADSDGAGGVSLIDRSAFSNFPVLSVYSSVISGNVGFPSSPDLTTYQPVDSYTSFFGVIPTVSFDDDETTLTGDPKLGPLQDNGGPTHTRMPAADSPLLDSSYEYVDEDDKAILNTDQRGSPRKVNDICDVGAVEHPVGDQVKPTVTIAPAEGQSSPETGDTVRFAVQFDQHVEGFVASDVDLTASTVGGTLVTTIVKVSSSSYIVEVTGMTGIGDVVASLKADAGVDWAGNGSPASANPATVGYTGVGKIELEFDVFKTQEGSSIVVKAARTGVGLGTASAALDLVAGTANTADYTAPTGLFEWAAGETGEKSLTVVITDDDKNEGVESFKLKLTNAAGSLGLPALDGMELNVIIDRSDAATINAKTKFQFLDEDGDKAAVKITGGASAQVFLNDPDGDGQGSIDLIDLPNSDEKSTLTVSVAKVGDGLVDIGSVGGKSLKSLNAPKSNLVAGGASFSGYVGSFNFNSISNGADIYSNGESTQKTKITIRGAVGSGGTEFVIGNHASKITAASFPIDSLIFADSIGVMTINGNFSGDMRISGAGVDHTKGKKSIGSITVKGAMNDSLINVTGNVGSVSAHEYINSHIYGGYRPGAGFNTTTKTTVDSFKITPNKKLGLSGKFENSNVFADQIKTATLANVITNNNGSGFGLTADTSYDSVTFTINGKKSTTKKSADFTAIGDFDIVIV